MNRTKKIGLLLASLLSTMTFVGCGNSDQPEERDVYQSKEECQKDWNDGDLCEQMDDTSQQQYRDSTGVAYPLFWGPRYYSGSRSVYYKGQEVSPIGRSSSLKSFSVTPSSSSFSRGGVSTPRSVSTGGFGGRSFSGGS